MCLIFQAAAAERKARGRSGWPQTIWAQDLKTGGAHPSTNPASAYLPNMHQQAASSTTTSLQAPLTQHGEHHSHVSTVAATSYASHLGATAAVNDVASMLPNSHQIKSEVTDMLQCGDSVESCDMPPSSCHSSLGGEEDEELSPSDLGEQRHRVVSFLSYRYHLVWLVGLWICFINKPLKLNFFTHLIGRRHLPLLDCFLSV